MVTQHEQRVKRIRLLLEETKKRRLKPTTIDPILAKARELFPMYSEKVLYDYARTVLIILKVGK